MSVVREQTHKVPISSRIPADLATELNRMAEVGNRTISREIWAAVAEHVASTQDPPVPSHRAVPDNAGRGDAAPAAGAEDFSAKAISSREGAASPP